MSASSRITLIQYGGKAPADAAENTAFHQDLIDTLQAEARRSGWLGCAIDSYQRRDGYVSLAIVPGALALDLETLRAFRERQRVEALGNSTEPAGRAALHEHTEERP